MEKFKDFITEEKLDASIVKLQRQMTNTGFGGDKILVTLPGAAKAKTLNAGSSSQESREMDWKKQDKFAAKIEKFIKATPTFSLVMKMHLSGKWTNICNIEVEDGKVTSEKWYM